MAPRTRPHEKQRTAAHREKTAICLAALRDHGPATIADLARITGLSRPTVDSVLSTAEGLVIEQGLSQPAESGGRRAMAYSFNAEGHLLASVDVGLHTMTGVLTDLNGSIRAAIQRPVDPATPAKARIALTGDLVTGLLERAGRSGYDVYATCACVTGIVDTKGRMVRSHAHPEWNGVDLVERFGAVLPGTVLIENDVNMATVAEHALGAASLSDDVVFVLAGHRINAAIMLGGELHRGAHGAAGEIGHLSFSGWSGPLTEFGDGIRLIAGQEMDEAVAAANAGDPEAIHHVAEAAEKMAIGIVLLTCAVDPEIIVIGGGMSRAGDVFFAPLREAVNRILALGYEVRVEPSTLGAEGVALGGIVRCLKLANSSLLGSADLPLPSFTPSIEFGEQ